MRYASRVFNRFRCDEARRTPRSLRYRTGNRPVAAAPPRPVVTPETTSECRPGSFHLGCGAVSVVVAVLSRFDHRSLMAGRHRPLHGRGDSAGAGAGAQPARPRLAHHRTAADSRRILERAECVGRGAVT
eukprot:7383839-Prymnesium_polylepis.1